MNKYIDVIVPRGGKNLVKKVQKFSNVTCYRTSRRIVSYIFR